MVRASHDRNGMDSVDQQDGVGVVLAGAAALGAYEVGVLSYVLDEVAHDLGTTAMPDVLAGTSAGAINATALAAFADAPLAGVTELRRAWSELRLARTVRPSSVELLSMFLDVTGAPASLRRAIRAFSIRGGLLDPAPIARQIERAPIARIAEHLRAGRLRGVANSATRVSNGEAVVFHQALSVHPWSAREHITPIATELTVDHVLASAAIPLVFPAVTIAGELYCDGGLRQMVPLSPALHLGATRLLVVNPLPARRPIRKDLPKTLVTSPLYLAGKALNALFADRVEVDLARLEHTNAILRAGRHRFGPSFEREINRELARAGEGELREIASVRIEPTRDLGIMAAEYVASRAFAARVGGPAGILLRWLADADPERVGDLLAYLMFDGAFTTEVIELGRADARTHHEALCALFGSASAPPAAILQGA
jgi:NTE family protein